MCTRRYATVLSKNGKTLYVGVDAQNLPEACQTLTDFQIDPNAIVLVKDLATSKKDEITAAAAAKVPAAQEPEPPRFIPRMVRRATHVAKLPYGVKHVAISATLTACDIDMTRDTWVVASDAKSPVTCALCRQRAGRLLVK